MLNHDPFFIWHETLVSPSKKLNDSKYKFIRVPLIGAAIPYIQLYIFCPLDGLPEVWNSEVLHYQKKEYEDMFQHLFINTC